MKNAIILFIVALFLANCQNDEAISNQKIESVINYDDYLTDLKTTTNLTKKITFDIISSKKLLNKRDKEVVSQPIFKSIFKSLEETNFRVLNDMNFNSYNEYKIKNLGNTTIDDINLPEKAVIYFKKLYVLQKNDNFNGILDLLKEFKKEKNNPDLLSLIGVFSVIELNQDNLLYQGRGGDRSCKGKIKPLIRSAIKGAVIGAISGALYGSWLGPFGTLAGAIGGAIQGGSIGGVGEIAVQAMECALDSSYLQPIKELGTGKIHTDDIIRIKKISDYNTHLNEVSDFYININDYE